MIKKLSYIAIAAMVLMLGCTKDFEEIDRPKTTSDKIDPNALFTRTLVTGSGISAGVWQWMHQISGSVYAQHFTNIQLGANFTSDNYEPRAWNVPWAWYFASSGFAPMMYNHHVILLSQELENPIKEAVARIWNVFLVQQVTDMYGDMPLSQALVNTRPEFDSQKDIYIHMLRELETGVSMIKQYRTAGHAGFGQADVLYNGNLDSWIRFANTMTLRLALRASNTAEFDAQIRPFLQAIDINETMSTQAHTAKIDPDPNGPTYHVKNPLVFVHAWNEVRLSKTMYDILLERNDPRLQIYARPNAAGEYAGLQNGQPHADLSQRLDTYFRPNYSNIGQFFTRDDTPHYLVTAAEAYFMKAEAVQRGFLTGGTAEEYYNQGIIASFQQFGITDTGVIDTYLEGQAKFNPSTALEQIWTQRWIALYPNGHEAWSVVRRTGVPQMMQPVYTFPGNDDMPRRKQYPDSERQYNADSYQKAVARMGGDSQYTRMWWDGGN